MCIYTEIKGDIGRFDHKSQKASISPLISSIRVKKRAYFITQGGQALAQLKPIGKINPMIRR